MDPRRLAQLNKGYQYAYEEESIKNSSTTPIKIPQNDKGNFKHQQRYYTDQSEIVNPSKSPGNKIASALVEASETYARNRAPSFSKQTVSPSPYAYVTPGQDTHFKEHSPKFGSPSTGAYGDDDPIKGKPKDEKGEPQLTIYTRSNVGKSGFGNPIDWNSEFQKILEMPEVNEDQKFLKYNKLSILSKDFVSIAKRIGKIIITERSLPVECRTINPASVGGVAGGEKYVYHGILFKFAMDWMNIYGGDQFAMKAAAHELKSVIRYYGNDGIHVPLMALIDYRGWRLIAMSILPLGKDTLVYGSNDAGTTVFASLPEYNKKMEAVGRKLNLKGHLCGIATKQFLYAPCDIEGHLGTDTRFYVVDYARVFPPTADDDRSAKGSFLYKLFRPEFLKKLKYPLSSDSFSHFGGSDNKTEHNQENIKATQELYLFIKQYAIYLDANSSIITIKTNITELLHREGINIRYLGLLRSSVKDTKIKQILLSEMVARVIKNISRDKLRKKMSKLKASSLSEDPYKQVIVNFLNLILGWRGEKSKKFWSETVKTNLLKTFLSSLSSEEQNNFDIKTQINMYYLFLRISEKTGIKFSKQSRKELKKNPANFNVVISDIKKVSVQVKHMNIVSISEGNALSIQSMRIEIGGDRLFRLAMSKFEEAISSTPDNQDTLNNYADVLCRVASKASFDSEQEYQYFKTAFDKYCVANNAKSLVKLASLLAHQKLKLDQMWSNNQSQLFDLAEKCYNEAIKLGYDEKLLHDLYHHFGDLLCSKFRLTRDSKYLSLAGEKYRTAISYKSDKYGVLSNVCKNFSYEELALVFEIFFTPLKNFAWEPNYVTMTTWHTLDVKHLVSTSLLDNFILKFATTTAWNLTSIILSSRSELTDNSIVHISKSFTGITTIDLSKCTKITNESIIAIALNIGGNLKQLNISECEGIASEEGMIEIIKSCNNLVSLDVSNTKNAITSVKAFSLLGNLKMLETLNLAQVQIGESVSSETCNVISSLVNLKSLNLSGFINLCDEDLKEISKKLNSLKELTLKNCYRVGDTGLESIMKSNTQLQIIRVSGSSDITSQLFISASKYSPNLVEFNVHRCFEVSSIDNSIDLMNKSCQNLQILDVSGTSIDSSLLAQLQPKSQLSSPKLKYLDLSSTKVSDDGIRLLVNHYIANSYGLTWLSLANCVGITDKSLEYISHSVVSHSLQYLSLHGLQNITDHGISALFSKPLESLLELDLTRCNSLTAESFTLVATRCKKLKELKLRECRIVNETIKEISENLHWLKVLDLRECLLISTFGDLPNGCPYIETLLLEGCEHISDIENIAQFCALKRLNLSKCKRVTDLTIKLIEEGCPSLQLLELGTNKTSDTAIEILRKSRSDISIIIQSNLISTSSGNITTEATPKTVKSAMRSLMYDLKHIETNPLPLVSAYPLEGDMFIWHGNLVGPENTPYAGGIFHIELKFPRTYPQDSPSATILCPLPHPHVTNGKICMDLLSDYSSYFQNMDAQNKGEKSTGWSSAYSVQTLLLQLQAFLMELDDAHGPIDIYLSQIPDAIKYSKTFECKTCSHKPGHPWPSIIATSDATTKGKISELDLIRQELVCYHSRISFTEDILGLGVSVERNPRGNIKNISSPLELLSQTAFKEGVRKSIMNDMEFSYWLPVYINPEHYKRAASAIRTSISKIATGGENNFTPELAVEVLTKLMNTMIVNIMSGQLHASIKCLQGYCYFQRLLLHFAKEYPTILSSANKKVNDFILNESLRHKKVVPALGEFLPLLLLTEKRWRDIAQYYLRETFDRNAFWILQKHPELGKYDYDKDIDPSRNQKTFLATQVSLKLLLFHVYFLERVARPAGLTLENIATNYDKLLGHPANSVKEELQASVKDILQLESWEEFFRRIGVQVPSDMDLNMWLRRSVFNSLKRGYHGSEAFKKKEACKTYAATGYCKYGKNCKFAH